MSSRLLIHFAAASTVLIVSTTLPYKLSISHSISSEFSPNVQLLAAGCIWFLDFPSREETWFTKNVFLCKGY